MRHRVLGRRLGRDSEHHLAMRRNMVASLFEHETISTTIEKAKEVKPFALYKTKRILYSGVNFNMPPIEPIKKKYSDIVGVTHYKDNPDTTPKVVIEFLDYQFNYFKTEPWVETFDVEKITKNDETVRVSFYVHPNNELHQRILFNNVKCKVLEPQSLVDRIKEILTDTLNLYK